MQKKTVEKQPTKNKLIEITITLPTNAYFLSGIRDFTLNLIKNTTNFDEKWAFRFQAIVDELCNNAIEHGSREGDLIKIVFQNLPEKYIQIIVEDTGNGPNPLHAEDIRKILELRKNQDIVNGMIRGRGLPKIVSEWTDELEFTDLQPKGIRVRVKKNLNPAETEFVNNNHKDKQDFENTNHIILN